MSEDDKIIITITREVRLNEWSGRVTLGYETPASRTPCAVRFSADNKDAGEWIHDPWTATALAIHCDAMNMIVSSHFEVNEQ